MAITNNPIPGLLQMPTVPPQFPFPTGLGPTNFPGGFSGFDPGVFQVPAFGFPMTGVDPSFFFSAAASSFNFDNLLAAASGTAVAINFGPDSPTMGVPPFMLGFPYFGPQENPRGQFFGNAPNFGFGALSPFGNGTNPFAGQNPFAGVGGTIPGVIGAAQGNPAASQAFGGINQFPFQTSAFGAPNSGGSPLAFNGNPVLSNQTGNAFGTLNPFSGTQNPFASQQNTGNQTVTLTQAQLMGLIQNALASQGQATQSQFGMPSTGIPFAFQTLNPPGLPVTSGSPLVASFFNPQTTQFSNPMISPVGQSFQNPFPTAGFGAAGTLRQQGIFIQLVG